LLIFLAAPITEVLKRYCPCLPPAHHCTRRVVGIYGTEAVLNRRRPARYRRSSHVRRPPRRPWAHDTLIIRRRAIGVTLGETHQSSRVGHLRAVELQLVGIATLSSPGLSLARTRYRSRYLLTSKLVVLDAGAYQRTSDGLLGESATEPSGRLFDVLMMSCTGDTEPSRAMNPVDPWAGIERYLSSGRTRLERYVGGRRQPGSSCLLSQLAYWHTQNDALRMNGSTTIRVFRLQHIMTGVRDRRTRSSRSQHRGCSDRVYANS